MSSVIQFTDTLATGAAAGTGHYQAALSPSGSGTKTAIVNAVSGTGTKNIPWTATAGGSAISWWLQVGDMTSFTSTLTAVIRALESATGTNAGVGMLIEHYDADGTTYIGDVLTDRTVPATISELTTSVSSKALASVSISSVTADNGDWFKFTFKARNVGTMGTGTVSLQYNQASTPTSVTFDTTVPVYVEPPSGAPSIADGNDFMQAPLSAVGGTVADSLILMWLVGFWDLTGAEATPDLFGADGFTYVDGTIQTISSPFVTIASALFYKRATGADSGNYTTDQGDLGGNPGLAIYGTVERIVDASVSGNPVSAVSLAESPSNATLTIPSITPEHDKAMLQYFYWGSSAISASTPSGWDLVSTLFGDDAYSTGVLTQDTAEASGLVVLTPGSTGDCAFGLVVVIDHDIPKGVGAQTLSWALSGTGEVPAPPSSDVTVGAVTHLFYQDQNVNYTTFTHHTGPDDTALYVLYVLGTNGQHDDFPATVTANGTAMTLVPDSLVHSNNQTSGVEGWYELTGVSGDTDYVVLVSVDDSTNVGNYSLYTAGVSVTSTELTGSAVDHVAIGYWSDSDTPPFTLDVDSASGHLALSAVINGTGVNSSNQTDLTIENFATNSAAGNQGIASAPGDTTVSFTWDVHNNDWSAISNIDIAPAASGPSTPEGLGTQAYSWAQTSAGGRKSSGHGALTSTWALTGHGGKLVSGSGSLTMSWAQTGTGEAPVVPPSEGSGTQAYSWALTGLGHKDPSGSGTLTSVWALSGTGVKNVSGLGSLAFAWSQSGTGSSLHEGSGSLFYAWAQAGTGAREANGSGVLSASWSQTGRGEAPIIDAATGRGHLAYSFDLTGTGRKESDGSGTQTESWALTGTGIKSSSGSGSLTVSWSQTGTGEAPVVGGASGHGHQTQSWNLSGSGHKNPRGSSSQTESWYQIGIGEKHQSGSGHLSYSWALTGTGEAPAVGAKSGAGHQAYSWHTSGSGKRSMSGGGHDTYGWVQTGHGWFFEPAIIPDDLYLTICSEKLDLHLNTNQLYLSIT